MSINFKDKNYCNIIFNSLKIYTLIYINQTLRIQFMTMACDLE